MNLMNFMRCSLCHLLTPTVCLTETHTHVGRINLKINQTGKEKKFILTVLTNL